MNRRQFAKNTIMASAVISASSIPSFSKITAPANRSLKKGIMWGSIGVGQTIAEKFQAAELAGFDGVEVMSHLDRIEVLKACDTTGLIVPSVCNAMHWKFLLSDPNVREEGVTALNPSCSNFIKIEEKTA